jgi:colanic acid/amylovoran biosynthesis glycosyltransferase
MSEQRGLHVGYVLKRFPRLSQTFVLNEIAELNRQGMEITVVARHSPREGERLPDGFPTIPVHYLDRPGVDAAAELRSAGISHLHAHFATWAAATARDLAADLGVSFSFTAHAHDIYHHDVDRAQLAATIERAEFVVTVSEANRQYLDGVLAAEGRTGRVLRLYNGVDLSQLRPSGHVPVPGRIVSVGRLVPKKGLTHLVEACRRLKSAGCAFECVIVGDGPERENLERQIGEADLRREVVLAGALSHGQTLDVLRSAAICALPCVIAPDGDRDGLPTVLLEALALGLPVVSTTVSGVPEIVEHGDSGLLVRPGDPVALMAAIKQLLSASALRTRLAHGGIRRVQKEFDLRANVASLKELFRLSARPRKACA